eukprot:114303-Pelagomonas_calceolata.AAC.1
MPHRPAQQWGHHRLRLLAEHDIIVLITAGGEVITSLVYSHSMKHMFAGVHAPAFIPRHTNLHSSGATIDCGC